MSHMPDPLSPCPNARYRSDHAAIPPSMIHLIPNRRSANGSRSMKPISDICPNV